MAEFPVEAFPAEVITRICQHLPTSDLHNFRLTGRWARSQGFFAFSERYGTLRIDLNLARSELLYNILTNIPQLARRVKRVTILSPAVVRAWRLKGYTHGYKSEPASGEPCKIKMSEFLALFPELESMQLENLESVDFSDLVGVDSRRSTSNEVVSKNTPGPLTFKHVRTLSLDFCKLTAQQLTDTIDLAGPALQNLNLQGLRLTPTEWQHLLTFLKSMSSRLQALNIGMGGGLEHGSFHFGDRDQDDKWKASYFHKRIDGGFHAVGFKGHSAQLTGSWGVELGCDMALVRLQAWL